MHGMKEEFRTFVSSLEIGQPLTVLMASTVTGKIVPKGDTLSVKHWVKQLESPVLFQESFSVAMNCCSNKVNRQNDNVNVIIEVGLKPILS